ncbi:MAG TPA: aldo/keto reductase [Burkholderiales bacterium]|nr:aldo/keto reductase [Burkholderiales bacterium]
MKTVALPAGEHVPAFGQGTWFMGDDRAARAEEIATLRFGIDLGATLIDTAEMYGDGRAEELVSEAISGRRDEVFLVSKVLPNHATRRGTVSACEKSLQRLRTDRLDLYLLHWRGSVPLAESLEALRALKAAGKIRHYGVSNLDLADMQALAGLPGKFEITTDQLLYNLVRRSIEWDLLPWLRARRIPAMAYSPLEQARLVNNRKLASFARKYGMTAAQVALAWLLAQDDVIAIPKSARRERLRENIGALDRPLTASQLAELDVLFPPPQRASSLDML